MRLFITGGNGFIGRSVIRRALLRGLDLTISSRSESAHKVPSSIKTLQHKSLKDLRVNDFKECDAVIHLAAHTANPPYAKLSECIEENAMGTLHLLRIAKSAGVKKVVIAGSCFEYGSSGNEYDRIPTHAALKPTNSYATSKALASRCAFEWSKENQIDLEILRLFHVFGPGELKTRFWPSLMKAAINGEDFRMSKGEQIRDFLYVDEVADLFIERSSLSSAIRNDYLISNVVSTEPMSLASFARFWWKKWQAKGKLVMNDIPYRENEVMRYVGGENCYVLESKWRGIDRLSNKEKKN